MGPTKDGWAVGPFLAPFKSPGTGDGVGEKPRNPGSSQGD